MDLDLACASAVVRDGRSGFRTAVARGVGNLLREDGAKVFAYLQTHYEAYSEVPSAEVVTAKIDVLLVDVTESLLFFVDELQRRRMHELLVKGMADAAKELEGSNPEAAYRVLVDVVGKVRESQTVGRIESMADVGEEALAAHDKIRDGARGMPLPWKSYNDATFGLWEGEIMLLAARSGIGKTFAAILLAGFAEACGYRVLVCSPEMKRSSIGARYYPMMVSCSHAAFRQGNLQEHEIANIRDAIAGQKERDRFWVAGGDFTFDQSTMEAVLDQYVPDLLVVDGAYLFKAEEGGGGSSTSDRSANMVATFNWIKSMALRRVSQGHPIRVVITSQMNRSVDKNNAKSVKDTSVALSDVAIWNSDHVMAMVQTEDDRAARKMLMKPLKTREAFVPEFWINWDLDVMDFREQDLSNAQTPPTTGFDDDAVFAGDTGARPPEDERPMDTDPITVMCSKFGFDKGKLAPYVKMTDAKFEAELKRRRQSEAEAEKLRELRAAAIAQGWVVDSVPPAARSSAPPGDDVFDF